MRKLLTMLFVLFIAYLGIQFLFTFFGKGEEFKYEIEKNGLILNIEEKSNFRLSDNEDNYQFKIKTEKHTFNFQIFKNLSKNTTIIKDIAYYKDDKYECILPIFKDKLVLSDVMCYENELFTYYYNLKGKSSQLDSFVSGIKEYDASKFVDSTKTNEIEGINVYKENLVSDHYIELTNYLGIYNVSRNFNSTVYKISLYDKDVYNQKISAFRDEYFISADYNQEYEFNKFNVIDFVKLNTFTITSSNSISFDSYIQGVVDGKVYLYDKDNKKQYEIDPVKKTVVQVSANGIKFYNNGNWETMTALEASNEKKFIMINNEYQDNNYERIDKVGSEQGYYYMYKKTASGYDIYRMDMHNKDSLIFLYSVNDINNVFYTKNYVYFINKNTVKLFNNQLGIKTLVTYNELEFNKNINFYVYAK